MDRRAKQCTRTRNCNKWPPTTTQPAGSVKVQGSTSGPGHHQRSQAVATTATTATATTTTSTTNQSSGPGGNAKYLRYVRSKLSKSRLNSVLSLSGSPAASQACSEQLESQQQSTLELPSAAARRRQVVGPSLSSIEQALAAHESDSASTGTPPGPGDEPQQQASSKSTGGGGGGGSSAKTKSTFFQGFRYTLRGRRGSKSAQSKRDQSSDRVATVTSSKVVTLQQQQPPPATVQPLSGSQSLSSISGSASVCASLAMEATSRTVTSGATEALLSEQVVEATAASCYSATKRGSFVGVRNVAGSLSKNRFLNKLVHQRNATTTTTANFSEIQTQENNQAEFQQQVVEMAGSGLESGRICTQFRSYHQASSSSTRMTSSYRASAPQGQELDKREE